MIMALFGSSGIRGLANKEIIPELALKVGLSIGSLRKSAVIDNVQMKIRRM